MITPRFKRRSSDRNPRTQVPSRSPSASAQVVQVLSVVGLLATVFFAYMSWRESRLAREDQAAYFIAEKVPQLELVEVHSVMGMILTQFRNVGESVARNVVASATPQQFGIGEAEASPDRPDQSLPEIVVQKGQSSQVPVNTQSTQVKPEPA